MRDKYQQAKFERYSEQLGYGDFEEGEPDDDGRTRYRNPNTQGRWNFWVASRDALALQPSASAEPVQAEAIARRFHEAYERLAPSFGYTTRQDTREWSPESTNGQLMIAVCEELFASPVTAAPEQEASATGAEPAGWLRVESEGRESLDPLFLLGKTTPNKTHYRASYAPLFTYRHLREYAAIARQQGRNEILEWKTARVRAEAFAAGWRTAANWMERDDLIADIGSPAYIADRDRSLKDGKA